MCGITGQVGKPKNRFEAYSLATHLLRETKRRGRHATGFFAIDLGGEIKWHKLNVASDAYVKRPEWKTMLEGFQALIGHCRFATQGAHSDNINNHPFLSKSGNHALVHNGVINLYDDHKDEYKDSLESECDSELILRIILREKDIRRGIRKVYELLAPGGDFACELIHKNPSTGRVTFYFFRDPGRPGVFIDARDAIGQFVVCSEEAIWRDAVNKGGFGKKITKLKTSQIPPYQVLEIDAETLETKTFEVEPPAKRVTVTTRHRYPRSSTVSSGYPYSGHGWGGGHDPYDYDDDYYKRQRATSQRQGVVSLPKAASVLDEDCWTETTNSRGLPRFIYDPEADIEDDEVSVDIDESEAASQNQRAIEDETYKDMLRQCIDNPDMRWDGWLNDAVLAGVLSYDEAAEYETSSEDALDFTDPTQQHYDSDQAALEDMADRLSGGGMVDPDDDMN